MKLKTTFLSLMLLLCIVCSCTPNSGIPDNDTNKATTIYGTGGEHSAEPDNEKD